MHQIRISLCSTASLFRLLFFSYVCNCVFSPDIDECTQSAGILCTFRCVNVPGSYQCACPEQGYTMAANGRTCRGNEDFRNCKDFIMKL